MNTVLLVNTTIGFSENLFLVNYNNIYELRKIGKVSTLCFLNIYSVIQIIQTSFTIHCKIYNLLFLLLLLTIRFNIMKLANCNKNSQGQWPNGSLVLTGGLFESDISYQMIMVILHTITSLKSYYF